MKIVSVVGARPQFVKLAPIGAALEATTADHLVVHTGQHYDPALSDNLFQSLSIPRPDLALDIGSGSHGRQTGQMLTAIESVLLDLVPDWVVVYGDTNSTLAATLAASKLCYPVAHVEAGLRSFNRAMPEEQNRLVADHLGDLLLAPTPVAVQNLAREGLEDRTHLVGDVMADVCLQVAAGVTGPPRLPAGVAGKDFVLATIHRPSNTDDPNRLRAVLDYLGSVPVPVVLAAHPRLVAKADEHGIELARPGIHVRAPFDYPDLVAAVMHAQGVVTDSGGLQKEAYLLGRACTTLRTETEWTETVAVGANQLDGDLTHAGAVLRPPLSEDRELLFGDGRAAHRIADILVSSSPLGVGAA